MRIKSVVAIWICWISLVQRVMVLAKLSKGADGHDAVAHLAGDEAPARIHELLGDLLELLGIVGGPASTPTTARCVTRR